ncbi:MAG: hypothetical protein IJI65_04185 [Lachnospiraceae bacterium]|jgi:hypothetical protein|nr:hypothetical protein [Lachnospiraceae bacterium]MBQ6258109.1 hypothetical protein [Lachnospiraceae bacterium]
MTYEEFQGNVIDTLEKRFPKNTSLNIQRILKTNDRELDGLVISDPSSRVSPTIYLDPLFDAFQSGSSSFDEIIDIIFETYSQHRNAKPFDTREFTDFERAHDNIVFRLVNRKRNKRLLSDVPFMPYLDLALTFYFLTELEGEGLGAILIHNNHMEEWGKKKEDLYEAARGNMKRLLPATITPMDEILKSMGLPDQYEAAEYERVPLFVLSNERKNYGAATILYEGQLKKAAEVIGKEKLCIIPSSVHEVLIMPYEKAKRGGDIDEMVREVNYTTLSPDEVLSDHAYYYDASTDTIVE